MMDSLTSEGISFKEPVREARQSRKRKSRQTDVSDIALDVLRTFEEPPATIPRRLDLYKKCLEDLQSDYNKVQDKFNEELNEYLAKFVKSSFELISESGSDLLPIGLVESGLSACENSALFDHIEKKLPSLAKSLKENVLFARIDPSCGSSTKTVFQQLCNQIVRSSNETDEEKKDGHFGVYDVKNFLTKERPNHSIMVLVEDVQHFANLVIPQVLTLVGCWNLQVIFIFGTSNAHFVDSLIPTNCPSQYMVKTIYSVSPFDRFEDLMRRVLFNPTSPFRVSGEIVTFLERLYKEENFSIEYICNFLALSMRYHFLNAASAVCSFEKSTEYSEVVKQSLLEMTQKQDQSPRKRRKANEVNVDIDALIDSSVESIQNWTLFLRLLIFINFRLPENPLGATYSAVYVLCSKEERNVQAPEEDLFQRFFKTLDGITKADFRIFMTECIAFLRGGKGLPQIELKEKLCAKFDEILNDFDKTENDEQSNNQNTEKSSHEVIRLKRRRNVKDLQQEIMESKRKKDGTTALHLFRTRFVTYLKNSLKLHLPSLADVSFSKGFVFSDLAQLVNITTPVNPLRLHEDLMNPGHCLQCDCCVSLDPSSVDNCLPDVSILHKLILEHTTKKIDLNLIYRSFLQVVEQKRRKSKAANNSSEGSYLIRFRRGIGELQHMGFLKRSKAKPDEITRLIWQ